MVRYFGVGAIAIILVVLVAPEPVEVTVIPKVCRAPAEVVLTARIEPHADNRWISVGLLCGEFCDDCPSREIKRPGEQRMFQFTLVASQSCRYAAFAEVVRADGSTVQGATTVLVR